MKYINQIFSKCYKKGFFIAFLLFLVFPSFSKESKNQNPNYSVELYSAAKNNFDGVTFGAKVKVPGITETLEITIPECTQTGTIISLKGKGIKVLNKNSYGDLFAKIIVEMPKSLDKKEKQKISELADSISKNQYSKKKNFNEKL